MSRRDALIHRCPRPDETSRTKTKKPAATRSLAERARVRSVYARPVAALLIVSRCKGGMF